MSQIFHRDLDAKSYGEFSELTSQDQVHNIRLNSLDCVKEVIDRSRALLLVLKPLVESHRATELLEFFPGSYVLWLYRDFRDVAMSNMNKFGLRNGIDDLRPIVTRESNNWRSEGVSAETQAIVDSYFSEQMPPADAQVLMWYTRNVLYFEQNLQDNPNVILCRYEDLTADPAKIMRAIYQKLGLTYPGDTIISGTHAKSVGRGNSLALTAEIEGLAHDLLDRLNITYDILNKRPPLSQHG
jgi:hypothetical protein